jgi:hypothetical protein
VQAWECPTYRQQFPRAGFVPELSCIDLLFNEGPSSLQILMRGARQPVSVGAQETFDRRRDTVGQGTLR